MNDTIQKHGEFYGFTLMTQEKNFKYHWILTRGSQRLTGPAIYPTRLGAANSGQAMARYQNSIEQGVAIAIPEE